VGGAPVFLNAICVVLQLDCNAVVGGWACASEPRKCYSVALMIAQHQPTAVGPSRVVVSLHSLALSAIGPLALNMINFSRCGFSLHWQCYPDGNEAASCARNSQLFREWMKVHLSSKWQVGWSWVRRFVAVFVAISAAHRDVAPADIEAYWARATPYRGKVKRVKARIVP
jgi:hypothetical protein